MKITYTSLQEIDGSLKRGVRQLRVDFGPSGRGETRLAEGGGGGRADSFLPHHAGLSDRRRTTKPALVSCQRAEEDGKEGKNFRDEASPALRDAKSITHLLVRKFVEAQMCSIQALERRGKIDIFA